jgi:hypothetical protein
MNSSETYNLIYQAFNTRDLEIFMNLMFPKSWKPVIYTILESGAIMSKDNCHWAPKWSMVPPTIRGNLQENELDCMVRSCIFRVHDCIHNLWGLHMPGNMYSELDRINYKKSQMAGEIAVLGITEFVYCRHLLDMHPSLHKIIIERDAIKMTQGVMKNGSLDSIVLKLNQILYENIYPSWINSDVNTLNFINYYRPMLERDRQGVDNNWEILKINRQIQNNCSDDKYDNTLTGGELSLWMCRNFNMILNDKSKKLSSNVVEKNRMLRNASNVFPDNWK